MAPTFRSAPGRDARDERHQGGPAWPSVPRPLRYAGVVSVCVLAATAVGYLVLRLAVMVAPLTLAVIVTLLLTTLLQPVTERLHRLRVPRAIGALAGVVLLLGVIAGPGVLTWRAAAAQASELPEQIDRGWSRTRDWIVDTFGIRPAQLDSVIDRVTDRLQSAAPSPVSSAIGIAEVLAAALLALVLLFFLLKDGPAMAGWLRGVLPARSRRRWFDSLAASWQALARWARGTVLVAAIDAVGIGLALVLIGVPMALPLALLTFLGAFVPIIGATVAGALATLVALAANGPTDALLVLAAVIVVQQIEGNLLQPLIMGKALRLHPAVVLVVVTAGTLTGGIAGALVAVPLTAVVHRFLRTFYATDSIQEGSMAGNETSNTPELGETELRGMEVDELRVRAARDGVEGTSSMRKEELVSAISQARREPGGGTRGATLRTGDQASRSLAYSQEITSPDDEPDRPGRSLATTNHDVIRRWAEARGAVPATVEVTEHGDHLGVLRFDFAGESADLRRVSWDEWFETFDARRLNFLFQEERTDGRQSNFFRLESPDREDA